VVWHKLLCYVYRLTIERRGHDLHYVLTATQLEALSQIPTSDAAFRSQSLSDSSSVTAQHEEQRRCLDLCIALLDHKLHGKLDDSIVVGFLAALGINREFNGFDDALLYTPKLSALVKIAQLLIVRYAVMKSREGQTQFPNELIAEMQDRFMVYGSESSMNWALNLRAYGAKLRDNTTCLGYINWSDDGQRLSYKSLEFTMNNLRWFLHDQVQDAQQSLNDILLLPKLDSDAERMGLPQVHLSSLKDDPTIHRANYSFIQDERNKKTLGGYDRYLLRRINQSTGLRRRFFSDPERLIWNT
jgi:hypothetical protein